MSRLVPVNLSVAAVHAAASWSGTEMPTPPMTGELDNWAQEAYTLDDTAAATLGFPVGSVSIGYKRQVLIFGSSRWKDSTASGHSYRFGVALRAILVVSELKGGGQLTLPLLAAKVELDQARATVQLLVQGYKGNKVAGALPTWQSFGVDSYANYMKSVSEMQRMIMEDASEIEPALLATTLISPQPPSAAASVGTVYALHAIAEGSTLAHAVDRLQTEDSEVVTTVRSVYHSNVGESERLTPNLDQREEARGQLHGLHLTRGWFHL